MTLSTNVLGSGPGWRVTDVTCRAGQNDPTEAEAERPLPVALLAREAAMSPFHLIQAFKREIGTTPHQFVLGLRFRRATRGLLRFRASVLQIALDTGFSDLSEFNRRFRRVTGQTPGEFRTGVKGGRTAQRS